MCVCGCVGVLVLSHRQVILSQEFSEEKKMDRPGFLKSSWDIKKKKRKKILVLTLGIRRSVENLQTTGTKQNFIGTDLCLDSGGWVDR